MSFHRVMNALQLVKAFVHEVDPAKASGFDGVAMEKMRREAIAGLERAVSLLKEMEQEDGGS